MKPSNRHSAALGKLKAQCHRRLTETAQPSIQSVLLAIPAPGTAIGTAIGTTEQAGRLYDSATRLDTQGKANGTVTKFGPATWGIDVNDCATDDVQS